MATDDHVTESDHHLSIPVPKMDIQRYVPRLLHCTHHHRFTVDLSEPGNARMIMSKGALECLQKVGYLVE